MRPLCPECAAGKHRNCNGEGGWSDEMNAHIACPCGPHPEHTFERDQRAKALADRELGWLQAKKELEEQTVAPISDDGRPVLRVPFDRVGPVIQEQRRQRAKGYTIEHDREHGVMHMIDVVVEQSEAGHQTAVLATLASMVEAFPEVFHAKG